MAQWVSDDVVVQLDMAVSTGGADPMTTTLHLTRTIQQITGDNAR